MKPLPWTASRPLNRRVAFAAAALLVAGSVGCLSPTYPKERLPEKVRDLCRREQKVAVEVRLVGRTLYLACDLDGLIGDDLEFDRKVLETFEGLFLSGTRAALSTDAAVEFLAVVARDSRLGSTVTLLRRVADVKGLFYMRYSRSDFDERLVLETAADEEGQADPDRWHDVTLPEFMARLVAARLHRSFTGNPLVSAFLPVRGIRGRLDEGLLTLTLGTETGATLGPATLKSGVLQTAIAEAVGLAVKKYDPKEVLLQEVRLETSNGAELWRLSRSDLLAKASEPTGGRPR